MGVCGKAPGSFQDLAKLAASSLCQPSSGMLRDHLSHSCIAEMQELEAEVQQKQTRYGVHFVSPGE